MAAGGPEQGGALGEADRLSLDPLKDADGQHDVVPVHRLQLVELHLEGPHGRLG